MAKNPLLTLYPYMAFHKVDKKIYSQFIEHLGRCVYGGIWVGEKSNIKNENGIRLDTVEALKKLELPVLRWPGGCFADNYNWKDGIGPREQRPKRMNIWWKQAESNEFGTEEFMRFCKMINSEPYLAVNVGSGTVENARQWVEYCNCDQKTTLTEQRAANGHKEPYDVKYWGIGNESWACGGRMTAEYYADLYRQYATFIRQTTSKDAKLIACGSHPQITDWDHRYLEAMKGAHYLVDYIALHIYSGWYTPDLNITDKDYHNLMIEEISILQKNLTRAINICKAFSTENHQIKVILDEWGAWHGEATVDSGLYQQNTLQDAIFAAAGFHLFHELSENLVMTNMAQTLNVLQALILTQGSNLVLTPTYHVYDMFKPHREAHIIRQKLDDCPTIQNEKGDKREALSVSVTQSDDEQTLFLSVINFDLEKSIELDLNIISEKIFEIDQVQQLTGKNINDHNTFESPEVLAPKTIKTEKHVKSLSIPSKSITTIRLKAK